ncbi:MAG: c-type cytochrome [Acidobacteria bacterium]|nr:c-type cytochrome [Acidobacteriota bacterium]
MTTISAGNGSRRGTRGRTVHSASRRLSTAFAAIVCAGPLALVAAPPLAAQETEEPSVWDGVYSAEQAMRGKKLYEATCSRCHGEDLSGANARPLAGESFIRDWGGLKLDGVLTRAKTMPPGAAGALGEAGYVDIIAYVLEVNEFPHGEAELTATRAGDVLVYGADGPDAVPNFAMVQVVGCLARDDRTWIVTDGSEPIRTRDPDASTGDVLALTEAMPLGGNTFELMYVFPDPDPYEGHRVEAKGFLIRREDSADAINVTTVASLDEACRP